MSGGPMITMDGNEAAASVAYRLSEVIAIYPITPSSPMGELADEWSSRDRLNIWGGIPRVTEMQSEGGAAGAAHGALQAGALATTFTASQGLLLMIPNMYKIAGELTPFCMHVSARTLATHALSIFGDHSDVMACRATGFGMLASGTSQETHDLACIGHLSSLESRIPFLHFFDGFRTSHEITKLEPLTDDDLLALLDERLVEAYRRLALTPDRPVLRGTAQNPDTFFQAREACNRFYDECPSIVQEAMDRFAERTGRAYHLFDYHGHPEAERVVLLMGSGAQTARETAEWLADGGEKVGVVNVRLFRPFSARHLVEALPATVRSLAVLDRTKEPGAPGDPLYLDVGAALRESDRDEIRVIGGRYGLSSKEFTPAMVKAVFDALASSEPPRHFTVGITDDVTRLSLPVEDGFGTQPDDVVQAIFYGLGSDGTVSANKNSIKIIGEGTDQYVQGYFVYDSKKAGSVTVSHLRFGPRPIRSTYLVDKASFVACHQFGFLDRYDVLEHAAEGATFLLNSPYGPEEVWDRMPVEIQEGIIEKRIRLHVVDAAAVAEAAGMGRRISTIMQTCFFAISGVLEKKEAIERIKAAIQKSYGSKGDEVIRRNFAAVDAALEHLHKVETPATVTATRRRPPIVSEKAPDFVQKVTAVMLANKGDLLPVSAFPVDGSWPLGTSKWEKRNLALQIPVWDESICIQCNKCDLVCPHAAIRAKVYEPSRLDKAPETFKSADYRAHDFEGFKYTIQIAPEDCTGCTLCAMVCPAKDKSNPRHKALDMSPQAPIRDAERANYDFFLNIPDPDRAALKIDVKGSQFLEPLFEYSGACVGCGETPYIKLMTQLFGDRTLIANATGCSSIYGGNLPTTPYTTNKDGRGPAWSNSLFEDNAEFGLGFRLAVDEHAEHAKRLLRTLSAKVGETLVDEILGADQSDEAGIAAQRGRVEDLRRKIGGNGSADARRLDLMADYLVRKSVWIVGGDGWAYDIGYGGLDHVLALGRDVNLLVLDTEVYSNTGGQQSKATPMGAAAKFAVTGKGSPKKDLGLAAMTYGTVYVARVAFGAKDLQTVKAFREAESYPGPSVIIAYSPCIAHGYDLSHGLEQQKLAVESGHWPLFRFDPRRIPLGESPLALDSPEPKKDPAAYMRNETRFRIVERHDPVRYRRLLESVRREAANRYSVYEQLARLVVSRQATAGAGASAKEKA